MRLFAMFAAVLALAAAQSAAQTPGVDSPPQAGPVEILPASEVHAGMQAVAWTSFLGRTPQAVPVEILGSLKNAWGPRQDIILAKLGGPAARTNVAGGMSGSPVYFEGKLLGAIALRFSTFSPDAIAGITPIELMLDIDEFDPSRPLAARKAVSAETASALDAIAMANEVWEARAAAIPDTGSYRPIGAPLTFSGAHDGVLDVFGGYLRSQGFHPTMGGAATASAAAGAVTDATGSNELHPGEPIAVVLMRGDMSASALGTVSYNDGRKVLAFGHPMFNSGPIEAPVASADVLLVLASQLNPVKIANSATIVGALRQDRHSGILAAMGEEAEMIPVSVHVRTFGEDETILREQELSYEVFQNQKLTAQLVVMALFNSMFGLNDFAEEATFRLSAKIDFAGDHDLSFDTMQTVSAAPLPAPLLLAASVGSRMQRVFTNTREMPRVESVEVTVDLLPKRRIAAIEQVWVDQRRVRPGDTVRGKVFLRPYRGERIEKDFELRIPVGASKGRLNITASDAKRFNQRKMAAAVRNRLMSLTETVSLLNQERSNDRVYISLSERNLTAHVDDQTMPALPATTLNVLRPTAGRRLMLENESPLEQTSFELETIVSGSSAVTIEVL